MATKKRKLNPFMNFMAKFRLQNKGKGWSVVEMAKEGGKAWRGMNGTVRKGKKTRGGRNDGDTVVAENTDIVDTKDTVENVGNQAKDAVENVGNQSKDAVENVGNQAKDAVENVGNQAKDAVENVGNQAKDAISSFFSSPTQPPAASDGGRRHRKRRGGFAEYKTGGRRTKSRRR